METEWLGLYWYVPLCITAGCAVKPPNGSFGGGRSHGRFCVEIILFPA